MKRCARCGAEYPDETRFCVRDGYVLDAPAESGTAPISQSPVPQPTVMKPADSMIGRTIAGRYTLLEKVGQGGMGAVYKGRHVRMNRVTAIKILTTELANNPEFVNRFEREAQMASTISHPNAVAIYDFGEAEDGLVYLAMEFLEGDSVGVLLARPRWRLSHIEEVIVPAMRAVAAIHARGIVHKNIKPDNIIACRRDGGSGPRVIKVLDVTVTKLLEDLDLDPSELDAPEYKPIEQLRGQKDLDARVDIYAFGVLLFEALTGTLPFQGESIDDLANQISARTPASPRSVRPEISADLDKVVLRALSRSKNSRYASMLEFIRELEAALAKGIDASAIPPQQDYAKLTPLLGVPVQKGGTPAGGIRWEDGKKSGFKWRYVALGLAGILFSGAIGYGFMYEPPSASKRGIDMSQRPSARRAAKK